MVHYRCQKACQPQANPFLLLLLPPFPVTSQLAPALPSSRYMDSTSTCLYCHQKQPDRALVTSRSHQSPDDEIAYIQAESRRIEDLIVQLHDGRLALLRRLNMLLSTTRVLSPEILSLIFQYASLPRTTSKRPRIRRCL